MRRRTGSRWRTEKTAAASVDETTARGSIAYRVMSLKDQGEFKDEIIGHVDQMLLIHAP
ncbi:MAG TPA: hypothetical protein VFJ14_04135 [Nocardioidaceae bacterium]|nr:hypothetical protein [Nocardioidaceae bacterium]